MAMEHSDAASNGLSEFLSHVPGAMLEQAGSAAGFISSSAENAVESAGKVLQTGVEAAQGAMGDAATRVAEGATGFVHGAVETAGRGKALFDAGVENAKDAVVDATVDFSVGVRDALQGAQDGIADMGNTFNEAYDTAYAENRNGAKYKGGQEGGGFAAQMMDRVHQQAAQSEVPTSVVTEAEQRLYDNVAVVEENAARQAMSEEMER